MVLTSDVSTQESTVIEYLDLSVNRDEFGSVLLFNAEETNTISIGLNDIQSYDERLKLRAIVAALGMTEHLEIISHNLLTYDGSRQLIYGFSIFKCENEDTKSEDLCLCSGNFRDEAGYLITPVEIKNKKFYVNGVELQLQEREDTYLDQKTGQEVKVKNPYFKVEASDLTFKDEDGKQIEITSFIFRINIRLAAKEDPQDKKKRVFPNYQDFYKACLLKKGETDANILERLLPLVSPPPSGGGGLNLALSSLVYGYGLAGLPCPKFDIPIKGYEIKPASVTESGKSIPEGIVIELDPDYLPSGCVTKPAQKDGLHRLFEGVTRFNIEASFPSYLFFSNPQYKKLVDEHIKQGTCNLLIKDFYKDRDGKVNIEFRPNHTIQLGKKAVKQALPDLPIAQLKAEHPFLERENSAIDVAASTVPPALPSATEEVDLEEIPF